MLKRTIFASTALVLGLAGCVTGAPDVMKLQQATTSVLGLASTDELALSNITRGAPNALGGSIVGYTAITAKGRRFTCSTLMMPGIVFGQPQYSEVKCKSA